MLVASGGLTSRVEIKVLRIALAEKCPVLRTQVPQPGYQPKGDL